VLPKSQQPQGASKAHGKTQALTGWPLAAYHWSGLERALKKHAQAAEAADKNHVLEALSESASEMRAKLGESPNHPLLCEPSTLRWSVAVTIS